MQRLLFLNYFEIDQDRRNITTTGKRHLVFKKHLYFCITKESVNADEESFQLLNADNHLHTPDKV